MVRKFVYVLEGAGVTADRRHSGRPAGPLISRRSLLTAAAAAAPLALTACKGVQALGTPPPPAADIRALEAAITAEKALLTRYRTALASLRSDGGAQPSVPAATISAVAAVRAEHAAHLAELTSRLRLPPGVRLPSASPSAGGGDASPTPDASPTATAGSVLAGLEGAEQAASDRLLGQLSVLPPSLAQLFASISASEATHVPYLRSAGRHP